MKRIAILAGLSLTAAACEAPYDPFVSDEDYAFSYEIDLEARLVFLRMTAISTQQICLFNGDWPRYGNASLNPDRLYVIVDGAQHEFIPVEGTDHFPPGYETLYIAPGVAAIAEIPFDKFEGFSGLDHANSDIVVEYSVRPFGCS